MYLKLGRWTDLEHVVERLGGDKTRNPEIHEIHEKEDKRKYHGLHGEHGYEGQILQARGMLARKEFEGARSILEPMVAAQPRSVYPRVILSHVYLQESKDLQAAERMLREIIEMD